MWDPNLQARYSERGTISSSTGNGPISKRRGCQKGCLVLFALLLIPYLIYASIIIVPNLFNHVKWLVNGSPSYTATVSINAFVPYAGANSISVKDGKVVDLKRPGCVDCSMLLGSISHYTIENQFADGYLCPLFFPLLICSFEYDPQLGYIREANADCPIPDACMTHVSTTDVKLGPR